MLINGDTIVSAGFMLKRNGIDALVYFYGRLYQISIDSVLRVRTKQVRSDRELDKQREG